MRRFDWLTIVLSHLDTNQEIYQRKISIAIVLVMDKYIMNA